MTPINRPILVSAAIIQLNDKYLIMQRPHEKSVGGKWEFPGGKVEFGEDPRGGLKREILEELDVDIQVNHLIEYSSTIIDPEKHVILMGFHCDLVAGDIKLNEHIDHAWVTLDEMETYDIAPADVPLMNTLKKQLAS